MSDNESSSGEHATPKRHNYLGDGREQGQRKVALDFISVLLDGTRLVEVDGRALPKRRFIIFVSARPMEEIIPELVDLVKEKCMLLTV